MLGWEPRIPLTEAFSERSNGPRRHGETEHGEHQTILKDDHIWTLTETDQGPLRLEPCGASGGQSGSSSLRFPQPRA
jgi:hypothetical protein